MRRMQRSRIHFDHFTGFKLLFQCGNSSLQTRHGPRLNETLYAPTLSTNNSDFLVSTEIKLVVNHIAEVPSGTFFILIPRF